MAIGRGGKPNDDYIIQKIWDRFFPPGEAVIRRLGQQREDIKKPHVNGVIKESRRVFRERGR